MHRYFRKLIKAFQPDLVCELAVPKRIRVMSLLADKDVAEGVAFEYRRKRVKYAWLPIPEWAWRWQKRRYERWFCQYHAQFSYLVQEKRPRIVALWNGHRLAEFAIKLLAKQRGFEIAYFENGLLPNTTTLDFNGVNDLNSLPRSPAFYRAYASTHVVTQTQEKQLVQRHFHFFNLWRIRQKHFVRELPKRFIFVPFQVCFDTQVLLNSPRVQSMTRLYDWLSRASDSLDSTTYFVIKEHPSDTKSYPELYRANDKILFSNLPTKTLIEKSLATVTLNSSVGLETLIFGKPVILLGNACYKIDGLTHSVSRIDELRQVMTTIQSKRYDDMRPDKDLLGAYLGYLKNEYCIPTIWRKPDAQHFAEMKARLHAQIDVL